MKKIIFIITLLVFTFAACAQQVSKTNITIEKIAPVLYLNGTSASINFYNNDIILQQSSNLLTLSGGNFSLGSNSLLGTGSIGTTSSRLTKGWFTDLEITNLPTINGGTLSSALSLSSYLLKSDTASMLTNYALLSEVSGGSMVYPTGSGIPLVVNGTSWGTTIPNNSTNWNTAYGWGNHASAGYAPLASPVFTGTPTVATTINPDANDGATLGQSGTGWSDLYLAEDAAITWGVDAAILQYSTDRLTLTETPLRLNDRLYLQSSVVLEIPDPDVTIDQTELAALDGVTGSLNYSTENYGSTGTGDIVLSTGATLTTVNITDVIKLTPTASPPAGATEGMIYADTDHHLYYYNGTSWVSMTD